MPRRANGIYYVETDWDYFTAPVTISNPETTITTTASSNGTIVVNNAGDLNITYDYSNVTIPTYEFTYNPKSGLQINFDDLYKYEVKPPKRCIRI